MVEQTATTSTPPLQASTGSGFGSTLRRRLGPDSALPIVSESSGDRGLWRTGIVTAPRRLGGSRAIVRRAEPD